MAAKKAGLSAGSNGNSLLAPSFPAPASQQRISAGAGTERKKVALKPGRSLMDWIRLGHSGKDLTGVGGRVMEVTPEELAKHNKANDCWMAIKGRVYNVSAYMEYHPGGEDELMRGVGADATQLFDEVHKWVNAESMLSKCFIGKLKSVPPKSGPQKQGSSSSLASSNSLTVNGVSSPNSLGFATPALPPRLVAPSTRQAPKYDWLQNDWSVTIVIYSKCRDMRHENVIIRKRESVLQVNLIIDEYTYLFKMELENDISEKYKVKVSGENGKVEIVLEKSSTIHWQNLGKTVDEHNIFKKTIECDTEYETCTIDTVSMVTHDTNLYRVRLPTGMRMCVPVGYHIYVKAVVNGTEIVRSYTVVPPSLLPGHYANSSEPLSGETPTPGPDLGDRNQDGCHLHLMIKIYPEGALTPVLSRLIPGDSLSVSLYDGSFSASSLNSCTRLIMCAAGTGFTPMTRLILHAVVQCPDKYQSVHLMFYNKAERDILWAEQLERLVETQDNFRVTHVLSQPSAEWTGLTGRIRKDILEEFIPSVGSADDSLLFCACGPTPFTNEAIQLAEVLGVKKNCMHAFLA